MSKKKTKKKVRAKKDNNLIYKIKPEWKKNYMD